MASNEANENFNEMAAAHVIQFPTGANNNRPFVIQFNDVGVGGAAPPGSEGEAAPQSNPGNGTVGGALPSLRTLIKPLEGSLPFLLIVLAKVLYDHRLGILVFFAMFGTFFHANSSLRRCIAQGENTESRGSLFWLIGFLAANIFCVYYVFDEQKLFRSLYLVCPEIDQISLWVLLWVTITTDFIIKFATMLVKAVLTLVPRAVIPVKKKGKWYMLVEMLSQSYRSIVPITPWFYFLYEDEHAGKWFSTFLLVIYIVCKGYNLVAVSKHLKAAFVRFRLDTSFGSVPSRSQIESCDSLCPICQDKFTDPVALSCTHVFCQDCVATWFNRERTCPMCRANIVETPQWRDGTTCPSLKIY